MNNKNDKTPLFDAIVRYIEQNPSYFRIPGHRGAKGISSKWVDLVGENIFKFDLTETPYLDDLHNPDGAIAHAQNLAKDVFGSDKTYFLINGTTCGNEAMVASTAMEGDEILIPRNAHKSVLMGLIISGATPRYIMPKLSREWGVHGGIDPAEVRLFLDHNPKCRAVFAVSPSYYGFCSDIKNLAEICHNKNIPLIVDEAHGAHCYFSEQLPEGAITAGADICSQSTHKVTGSLTQSSMLHVRSGRIDHAMLEANLHIVQSTSPSYLLMTSLDLARYELAEHGKELIANAIELADYARREIDSIDGITYIGEGMVGTDAIADYDRTRLILSAKNLGITGFELKSLLFNNFNIDMELSDYLNVLAIISFANKKDDINKLISALRAISKEHPKRKPIKNEIHLPSIPPYALSPRQAHFHMKKTIPWKEAKGCIAGEPIAPYPPGIPVIYPGELITEEIWEYLEQYRSLGRHIQGPSDPKLQQYKIIDQ